ncbi:MAG: NTP/NDP exchange transporter [Amoebophilaceae bacterium]|nr:NTP/NDP exchange transporter [Amoebophilaceae bacterium]
MNDHKTSIPSRLKKFSSLIWSLQKHELPKFFAMAILMFLILLNQNLIRGIKDSLIVTMIGVQVISFIKLFVEMPVGVFFVVIYTIMCNKMSTEKAFRCILLFFLSFFILFSLFLFPNQALLHPNPDRVATYIALYPHFKWFLMMWGKWILVLFYIMGELWPMIIFTLLYWQLANKITKLEEAGRFYFLFNLVGQSNLLISSSIMIYFSSSNHFLYPLLSKYRAAAGLTISSIMAIVVMLSVFILLMHGYIEKYIMYDQVISTATPKQSRLQLSLWESIKTVSKSHYLGLICLLMIAYSMVLGLVEGLWLHEANLLYRNDSSCFMIYQGKVLFWIGFTTLICSFLGNHVIRKLGWTGTALLTPVVTAIIGSCFFLLVITHYFNILPTTLMGIPSLAIVVAIGSLQNILIKGTKYCFFDITKEMAYIPLNNEMRTKGKAAVDILGGKIGKSSGAIVQVIFYTIFSDAKPDQLAPFLMVMFLLIAIIWIVSTKKLAQEYHKLTQ